MEPDFPSSQWSLIARAGAGDRAASRAALADLCRRYWYPIYAFVRRQTRTVHDAEDLTQGFFGHLLESELIAGADRTRGRFRTYLLSCCRNYLANDHRAKQSLKNGGGLAVLGLDFRSAETRYANEPADPVDPEALFRRRWALTVIAGVFDALEGQYRGAGQGEVFVSLKTRLVADGEKAGYAAVAAALRMTEPAARKAAQRLRERFRDELRRRVAQTVADAAEVDDEIRDLFAAVG